MKMSIKTFLKKISATNYKEFLKFIKENTNEENYNTFIYEFYPYIITGSSKKFNNRIDNLKKDFKNIENEKEELKIYNTILFTEEKKKMEEYDDYLTCPFEVVSGVIICGNCGSDKTWSVQKQTRSADEPMTTFSKCTDCKHSWAYNG
jgi:DNA-directed RNA polymerase subunit M/transcription elongation factor TFIIS